MEAGNPKLVEMYTCMVRSRALEGVIISAVAEGKIPASWMSGIGQEGAVGALSALREDDRVTYTHRGAYCFVCRGSDPGRILAELYGKQTGYCRGKGGRHLADTAHGLFGKSGTIGGHAPIAVGLATAIQIRGGDAVVMSFFGDGASNRGTTHESLNLAAVWKLPVVWVCENNGYAGVTPASTSTATADLADLGRAYGIPGRVLDGNDVLAVHEAAQEAVARARGGGGPSLLELKTYCIREFAEGGWLGTGYRDPEEVEAWRQRDPIDRFRAELLRRGAVTDERLREVEAAAQAEMQAARQFAEESEFPEAEEAFVGLYA